MLRVEALLLEQRSHNQSNNNAGDAYSFSKFVEDLWEVIAAPFKRLYRFIKGIFGRCKWLYNVTRGAVGRFFKARFVF